jgi:hypothetical protein
MLALVGTLSLIVLLGVYISENWFSPTYQGLSKPISFIEVPRDWLLYMLLFSAWQYYWMELCILRVGLCVRVPAIREGIIATCKL